MDEVGIARAVLVPPSWEGDYNDLVIEAATRYPDRFGIMGRIAPDDPQGPGQIAAWRQQPGMLGVRILFEPGSGWPEAGSDHWLWAAAEAAGVPLTLASRGYFDRIGQLAKSYPALRLSVDHLGADWSATDEAAFANLNQVLTLAKYPNVAVKLSMLPALSSQPYPYKNVHRYVRATFDSFGPKRCFWGANLSRLTCSYAQAVTMFTEEMPWLRSNDLESVMGAALCEWIGWDAASQPRSRA
jgi:predicted TIM-barrel fold metal-dependent hydrolase